MRRIFFISIFCLLMCGSSHALVDENPDYTMYWSDFSDAIAVDSFLIVSSDNGLMVCRFNNDSEMFEAVNHLFLKNAPKTIWSFDSVLAAQSFSDLITFVDISNLPDLSLLGSVNLDIAPIDIELIGNSLYTAAGFDGLRRYTLNGFSTAVFTDSSLLPIYTTDLLVLDTILFAVDNYNGILAYNIDSNKIGDFISILYSSYPATKLTLHNSDIYIQTESIEIYRSNWVDSDLLHIDTFTTKFKPCDIYIVNDNIYSFAFNKTWLDIINITSNERETVYHGRTISDLTTGTVFIADSAEYIVIPTSNSGIGLMEDTNPTLGYFVDAYEEIGPISTIQVDSTTLYTGGVNVPLSIFELAENQRPIFADNLFNNLDGLRSITVFENYMFALYPEETMLIQLKRDSLGWEHMRNIFVDPVLTIDIRHPETKINDQSILLGMGTSHLDVYVYSDSIPIQKLGILSTFSRPLDAEVIDSLLVFSTGKFDLWVYRIYDDFTVNYRSHLFVGEQLADLHVLPEDTVSNLPSRLLGFGFNNMYLFDLSSPSTPTIFNKSITNRNVADASTHGDLLYTVGSSGMSVYDVNDTVPQLIDEGGRGGFMIETSDNYAITSDSHSIHIYAIDPVTSPPIIVTNSPMPESPLSVSAYPNPFNPILNITLNPTEALHVNAKIYNALGQTVKTLIDEEISTSKSIEWDATDKNGNKVATGIYFISCQCNHSEKSTLKVIYLK